MLVDAEHKCFRDAEKVCPPGNVLVTDKPVIYLSREQTIFCDWKTTTVVVCGYCTTCSALDLLENEDHRSCVSFRCFGQQGFVWLYKCRNVCSTIERVLLKLAGTCGNAIQIDGSYLSARRNWNQGRFLRGDKWASTETPEKEEIQGWVLGPPDEDSNGFGGRNTYRNSDGRCVVGLWVLGVYKSTCKLFLLYPTEHVQPNMAFFVARFRLVVLFAQCWLRISSVLNQQQRLRVYSESAFTSSLSQFL